MTQMYHLKSLNHVFVTFWKTAIHESTLKVVGHFACWSHCAGGGLPPSLPSPPLLGGLNQINRKAAHSYSYRNRRRPRFDAEEGTSREGRCASKVGRGERSGENVSIFLILRRLALSGP